MAGEGNGNPLQCSWLENPRDRGAWWAAISGVAQSHTHDLAAAAAASKKWHFPGGLVVKDLCANAGDAGEVSLAPRWGSSPGGRNSYPLQYSCWENPMDRGACQTTVCGVTKSWATDARQESKTGLRSGLPWWSSGLRFCLPMQEVWVWSLVEGVKIHMPCNGKTKT